MLSPKQTSASPSTSRPAAATMLLRRFNALYKPASRKPKKDDESARKQPVHVPLFNLHHGQGSQTDLSGDSEESSSSSHSHSDSVASSSRMSLDSPPPRKSCDTAASSSCSPPLPPPARKVVKPLRPALKQTSSWNSSASTRPVSHELHVSFAIPPPPSRPSSPIPFHTPSPSLRLRVPIITEFEPEPTPPHDPTSFSLHPLFAYTHLEHAPISYDVSLPPCARTILGRGKKGAIAIPPEMLDEPATDPPCYESLTLISAVLPWTVVVRSASASAGVLSSPPRRRRPLARKAIPITNRDVLHALYNTLNERATDAEWASLGPRSRTQRRVARTYERRCVQQGGGWEAGVRRVDWLDGRTRVVGIALENSNESDGRMVGRVVFKSPI
ncbi:hypothetical protein FB45DRAFT_1024415 [Roridomyces roridus]|uniref:DUF6699 domain-containing protein n=1 Tax=Roridomyces roridus TaxID=1738132 RepID=A0AAD7C0L7_9AGAR|nr:hypothetical protein FB45DRAFT_1024415 [Roridomyces roridus]